MRNSNIIMISVLLVLLACQGCASYNVNRDSQGKILSVDTVGFLRTIRVSEEKEKVYDKTGKIILKEKSKLFVETSSNSADVMQAGNEMLGTAVGVARDLIP